MSVFSSPLNKEKKSYKEAGKLICGAMLHKAVQHAVKHVDVSQEYLGEEVPVSCSNITLLNPFKKTQQAVKLDLMSDHAAFESTLIKKFHFNTLIGFCKKKQIANSKVWLCFWIVFNSFCLGTALWTFTALAGYCKVFSTDATQREIITKSFAHLKKHRCLTPLSSIFSRWISSPSF